MASNEPLLRGLSKEDKEFFERTLKTSPVFEKLRELLSETIRRELEPRSSDYEKPSWAYYQADRNGSLRAYQRILEIISPIPETKGTK